MIEIETVQEGKGRVGLGWAYRFGILCGSVLATAARSIGGTAGGLTCGVIGAETGAEMASCERDVVG